MLNGVNGRPLFNVVVTISFSCSHHLLGVTFSWISNLYRIEHISKYSCIEKFMKLPFQHVVIHWKRSLNKGAMSILLQCCVLSKTDFRTCCTWWFGHNHL
jgi:hypothetical protein